MLQLNLDVLKEDCPLDTESYQLINYYNLNKKESLEILSIRNHSLIRSRMVKSNLISKEDHLNFVSTLYKKNVGYWALKKDNEIIGSISLVDYDKTDCSFVGGNFILPRLIGTGFGVFINYLMHYVAFELVKCKKIKAIVKTDNINAVRVNKLFGAETLDDNSSNKENINEYLSLEFSANGWYNYNKKVIRKLIKYVL
ncbi:hypothetical protein BFP77_08660 [Maribacter sp. 4U21]|uniref:GNAT family N-acetyltransferase n=1 Tax=Maribacter sp. 4U21 TaxID=1889779 RepID=UPI000C158A26|nr:GNAT family N-acetyltransferase [Maribacter sp. 4U21]PIB28697.1 hypothetical protein BFP77_08660 [Maribacter sp. 4U21]